MQNLQNKPQLPTSAQEMICFAVYSASHSFNRAYKPMLGELGLTYPQYMALTVLWENDGITVGSLCDQLKLESNTVTPLLKRLESSGHIRRTRSSTDERRVLVTLTKSGRKLQQNAPAITRCIVESTGQDREALDQLVSTISQIRDNIQKTL